MRNPAVSDFAKLTALVVGDAMLDAYLFGDVRRISPEAPVPVVEVTREESRLGGAANAAANVASLGAHVRLVAAVGADGAARTLAALLAERGITGRLVETLDRPTTVKTRVLSGSHQIVRIDRERAQPFAPEAAAALAQAAIDALPGTDVLVISDYGKGLAERAVLGPVMARAAALGIPVVVDPKGSDYGRYLGATVVTPNSREALATRSAGYVGSAVDAARALLAELPGTAVLLTQGAEGMTWFGANTEPVHTPSEARTVYDVTGAGDTVVATVALALAAGCDPQTACRWATAAAGIAVARVGVAAVTAAELTLALGALPESR